MRSQAPARSGVQPATYGTSLEGIFCLRLATSPDYSPGGAPRGVEQVLQPRSFGMFERQQWRPWLKARLEPAPSCLVNNSG